MSNPSFFGSGNTYRNLAQVAADAAAISEENAATSETNAAASAAAAAVSEGNAAASEATVASSVAAAATSASDAASQAANAETSATNASDSAATASSYATDAENWFKQYRDQYYGSAAADPTTDPDGNVPDVGDWYFNTGLKSARAYDGTSWADMTSVVPAAAVADDFVATAGQTQFQLTSNGNFIMVWLNGDYLPQSLWSISESGGIYYLDLVNAATADDDVNVVYIRAADLGQGLTVSVVDAESSTLNYVMASDGDGTAAWKPASGVNKQANNLGGVLSGVFNVDVTLSDYHYGALSGNATLTLYNPKGYSGTTVTVLIATNGHILDFSAVTWMPGSINPDVSSDATYMFRFTLVGTDWYGEFIGGA